jgi:hypothetical protein
MPSWLLKAGTQRLIGALPNRHMWNEFLQTRITRSIQLPPDQFTVKLDACRKHLQHLSDLRGATPRDFTAFELGTGWHPVVPIGLFLCGASQVWTWDIAQHLRLERIRSVLNSFLRLTRPESWKDIYQISDQSDWTSCTRSLPTAPSLPRPSYWNVWPSSIR